MKKILSLVLAVALVLTLGCAALAEGYNGELKIWVAEAAVDFTSAQVEAFKAANPEYADMTVKIEPLGEGDAATAKREFFERALYQASCKAAIKAGRVYDKEHIKWICDRVLTLDNIKYCPHGRPIAFEITKHFLEKQFERK